LVTAMLVKRAARPAVRMEEIILKLVDGNIWAFLFLLFIDNFVACTSTC